jgi:hypothetical protein
MVAAEFEVDPVAMRVPARDEWRCETRRPERAQQRVADPTIEHDRVVHDPALAQPLLSGTALPELHQV